MIEIKELTKTFGPKVAADNLTLTIGSGISGLVGENGAGKSTLFRLISNVYEQDKGTITIDGFKNDSKEAKSKLFFLADEPFFSAGDTPESLYKTYNVFYDVDYDKYISILTKFNLPIKNRLQTFSKGMKRQTFIALSLATKVDYLLMDEAFDGLDPLVLDSIKEEIIEKASSGTSIIISSHNISSLERLADRFIILYKGKLANEKENEDLAQNMVKLQLYFKNEVSEQDFEKIPTEVVSFKKIGSIINVVIKENDTYEKEIKSLGEPIIFERIPIDREEAVKLLLLAARKGVK